MPARGHGHRGSDLEVDVFGAPHSEKLEKYNNDPNKLVRTGGYTLTLEKWNSTENVDSIIKTSEQSDLKAGVGQEKIDKTYKALTP